MPQGNARANRENNPIIINEYGWLWLNRDGSATTLSKRNYEDLLGKNATAGQRRHLYARYLAAETEFWRSHRACAGVLEFCGLGYARPDGQTSDHFLNVEKLTFEPEFQTYVRDAFAPVGVMLDFWDETLPGGKGHEFPVVVINDLDHDGKGQVRLRLRHAAQVAEERTMPCEVLALGKVRLAFHCDVPSQPGHYEVEAALLQPDADTVRSLRDFDVRPPAGK